MTRNTFLLIILTCLFSLVFAQKNKTNSSTSARVHLTPGQALSYPNDALMAEEEGLVICRIFLDENHQYKNHQVLYSTHQVLSDFAEVNLKQLTFNAPKTSMPNFQFISPFIFELEKGSGDARPIEALMKDGNACVQYGLANTAIHFYDQMLGRKQPAISALFELHQARMKALLLLGNWEGARQEVTHMLAYARENQSGYAHLEASLRIQRSILSLLLNRPSMAIADMSWLDKRGDHNVALVSDFIFELELTREEARGLALSADALQANLPQKITFWLDCLAGVSLSHANLQTQAHARFSALWTEESDPELQAALLYQIGWSLYNQGKPLEALSSLEEATHLSPKMAQAHFYKALSLAKLDFGTEAYESMHNALELGLPHNQHAQGQEMLSILAVANKR